MLLVGELVVMEPFEPAGGKDSPPAPQQPCPLTWLCLFGSLHTNGVLSISRPLLGDGESSLCAFSNVFLMAPELLDIDDDGDAPGCLSLDLLPEWRRDWRIRVLLSVCDAASHFVLSVEVGEV